MKKLTTTLILGIVFSSVSANALEAIGATYGIASAAAISWGISSSISGTDCTVLARCKEAAQILADTQDYLQSGNKSLLLAQAINELKNENAFLSDEEAVDELTSCAQQILNHF